jgi:hypothetical protein
MRELHVNGSALNLSHGFQHIAMPIEKFILHKRQFISKTVYHSKFTNNKKSKTVYHCPHIKDGGVLTNINHRS